MSPDAEANRPIPDLDNTCAALPATVSRNEEKVRQGFWPKLIKALARIPFADRAIAAYYCALDPDTPLRSKGILLAALVYFIMPIDVIPDFILGLGFTDDLTVLATAIGLIRFHMKPQHLAMAQTALQRIQAGEPPE